MTTTRPRDLLVSLHTFPEREWRNDHTIHAAPVPVGDDHVVTDRAGMLRRLAADSEIKWEIELETLGGIARTPVFVPGKPGFLLVLSEDGRTWLVNAATGDRRGPRDIGSPPVDGPTVTRASVSARFTDGRVALWTVGLEPSFYDANGLVRAASPPPGQDRNSTLTILRRGASRSSTLTAPWARWVVEALDDEFRVVGPEGRGYTAEMIGTWEYMAWESPKALIPFGRLWVSDERGLRSYVPEDRNLVRFEEP